jgi:O-antigen ligase
MEHGTVKNKSVKTKISALGSRPDVWLAALLIWTLASAARSLGTPWAQAAGTEALRWGAGITLALTLGWFLRRTEIAGQFLVTLTGAMALFGILGGDTQAQSGLVGPYHDHQLYGSVLLLLLPFSAAAALSARSVPWRWGGLAAMTAGTLCLLLSQTRSAWAGFAAAVFVLGWLWLSRSASRPPRLRVIAVPVILLFVGLLFAWQLTGPADQQAELTHRAATLTALSQDGSWQSRLELWRGTTRMIAAHPVLGIGLGRYPGSMWLWTHAAGLLPPTAHPSLSNEAHSFYGQTAAEIGIAGLGLYCAALTAFAVSGFRRLRKSRNSLGFGPQSALLAAALSALAGQGIDALASPSWQFPEVSFFFWAVLGLGLASLRQDQPQSISALVPSSLRRVGQFAMAGTLAVVLTAQVLPIGLLTPVEAYNAPSSWQLTSASLTLVSPPAIVQAGTVLNFQVIASYKNSAGAVFTQNVTTDAGTTYSGSLVYPIRGYATALFPGGVFRVPSATYYVSSTPSSDSTLSVTAYFQDAGSKKFVQSNYVSGIQITPS